MVQKAFMTIVEHTANPKRFQDVLYVFRVGRGRGREGIGIPELDSNIDAFAHCIVQYVGNAQSIALLPEEKLLFS